AGKDFRRPRSRRTHAKNTSAPRRMGQSCCINVQNPRLDTLLSETQVLFDGRPASLIYVQQSQIKVQVPYEVAGQAGARVQVFHSGELKVDVTVPIAPAAPGIFTLSGGAGPAQIFLQDGSLNSATNPADPGST